MDEKIIDQIVSEVVAGRVKLHKLPGSLDPSDQVEIRRRYLARVTQVDLTPVELVKGEEHRMSLAIENCFGAVRIPVGVVGPMHLIGSQGTSDIFVPLATTEGALVASVNRGISMCNRAGGISSQVLKDGMTRAPVFKGRDPRHTKEAVDWILEHENQLAECCHTTSTHCKLIGVQPFPMGHILNLRLVFETGEAMGMNMVTFTAEECAHLISAKTGMEILTIAGNLCSDKKPASVNCLLGRGKTVCAWTRLPIQLVEDSLDASVARLAEVVEKKVWLGSAYAQSMSFNAHAANVIAATFAATGQDLAQIVESSNTFTWLELKDDHVLFTVQLQSLEVGTVGGGTSQSAPASLLRLMGCQGPGSAVRLAEVICAAVLAGELSYLGALAAGEAVCAHRKLGRKK